MSGRHPWPPPKKVRHASDCAVHNEPALPRGECDCGATPSAACGDERPHAAHVWHGVAKLEIGTKYGDNWRCPGVSAASGHRLTFPEVVESLRTQLAAFVQRCVI